MGFRLPQVGDVVRLNALTKACSKSGDNKDDEDAEKQWDRFNTNFDIVFRYFIVFILACTGFDILVVGVGK